MGICDYVRKCVCVNESVVMCVYVGGCVALVERLQEGHGGC